MKAKQFLGLSTEWLIYIGTFLLLLLVWYGVRDQETVGTFLYISMAATYLYILGRSVLTLEPHARDRIFAALFLITVQVLFWALFEQAGSSLNVYTDEQVDRTVFGQEVPASVFQSLNAMYIILSWAGLCAPVGFPWEERSRADSAAEIWTRRYPAWARISGPRLGRVNRARPYAACFHRTHLSVAHDR